MCIIVVKKEGYEIPKKDILQNCFNNNSDGAGIMFIKNNKVVIDKGFMNFNALWNRLEGLKSEIDTVNTPIILHFRIGTSGTNDGSCTHPFELTNSDKKLKKLESVVNIGIAHNGIINAYTPKADSTLNDTQLFIKKFLYPIYELNKNFYKNKKMQDIIKTVTNSKFAILNNNSEIVTIGDFIEDDGILYSNGTYKNYYNYYNNYNDYSNNYYLDYKEILQLSYDEAIDELLFLSDDEFAVSYNETCYIPYDYRKKGKLATDYYNSLYLVDEDNKKITFIDDYVEIYDINESEMIENERIATIE